MAPCPGSRTLSSHFGLSFLLIPFLPRHSLSPPPCFGSCHNDLVPSHPKIRVLTALLIVGFIRYRGCRHAKGRRLALEWLGSPGRMKSNSGDTGALGRKTTQYVAAVCHVLSQRLPAPENRELTCCACPAMSDPGKETPLHCAVLPALCDCTGRQSVCHRKGEVSEWLVLAHDGLS